MSVDRCTTHHICDCRQAMLGEAQREVKREREAADTVRLSNRELLRVVDKQEAIIATIDEALEPLTYMDCESWGCIHDEEPCAIEQAKKARARVGELDVR